MYQNEQFPLPTLAGIKSQITNQVLAMIMNQCVSGMQIFTCPPLSLSLSITHPQSGMLDLSAAVAAHIPQFPNPEQTRTDNRGSG